MMLGLSDTYETATGQILPIPITCAAGSTPDLRPGSSQGGGAVWQCLPIGKYTPAMDILPTQPSQVTAPVTLPVCGLIQGIAGEYPSYHCETSLIAIFNIPGALLAKALPSVSALQPHFPLNPIPLVVSAGVWGLLAYSLLKKGGPR